MRKRAITIILRKNGIFHLDKAIIHRSYDNFTGFEPAKVKAVYPGDGYGVALILRASQVDVDFGVPTLFLTEKEIAVLHEAFRKSDELTHNLLGHGWTGARPYLKVEDFL